MQNNLSGIDPLKPDQTGKEGKIQRIKDPRAEKMNPPARILINESHNREAQVLYSTRTVLVFRNNVGEILEDKMRLLSLKLT